MQRSLNGKQWDVFKTPPFLPKKSCGENLSNCKIKRSTILFFQNVSQKDQKSFVDIKCITFLPKFDNFLNFIALR